MLLSFLSAWNVPLAAQEERPQIIPGERKVPRKKDAGPRAVGVLQLAANGKASLVPIAILIDGKFWDASAYKADPIPMALEPGTVYEVERAGNSLGLFTVNTALHSNAVNVQAPWLGTGAWVPEGTEKPNKPLKAESAPVGIETNDAPPRLTRHNSEPKETPPASAPTSTPPPSTPAPSTPAPQTTPPSGSGDEPPRLSRPASSSPPAGSTPASPGQSAPTPTPAGQSKPVDTKPTDAKPKAANVPASSTTALSDSGADEANRPRLRRGKPTQPLPEDDVPGYSKPGAGASAAAPANAGKVPDQPTDKNPVQLIPAISDAGGPQPKLFTFQWLKDEEGERLQQMTALAKEQVRAYVEAQAKAKILPTPEPSTPSTPRRTAASKATKPKTADPILENVQMKAYDLWGNNQPVLVFTAEAHLPPPPSGSPHAATDSDLQYSILLVTIPDIYNNLRKLHVDVTDKFHLDITPRLELVDAVDADGDGRGELLFREISDNGNGWIIYRANADKLWKLFDSLKPQ